MLRLSGRTAISPRLSGSEFAQLMEFLLLHKHYEANLREYRKRPKRLDEGVACDDRRTLCAARQLGYMLGSDLYDAYISGQVTKRFLRSLFFHHLERPGAPRTIYFATQRRLRRFRKT
jgi:hypothetical protein